MARSRYQYPDLGQIVLGAAGGVGALADRRFDREHRKAKLALENKKYDESVRQFDITADQTNRGMDQLDRTADQKDRDLNRLDKTENRLQKAEDRDQKNYEIAELGKEAQIQIDALKSQQLLNSGDNFRSFDPELTLQALSYGDVPVLEDHIKNMAKKEFDFPDVPNEQMEIRRDQAEDGTIRLTLHAKGKDGEDLVFTQDGLVGPEAAGDKIVSFTTEQGLNMLNEHHRTGTHRDYLKATKNPLLLGLAIDATNADIEAAREKLTAEAEVGAKSKAVVKGMGKAAYRHFNSVVADANPAERAKIVREFAEDFNIDTSGLDVERPTELVGGVGEKYVADRGKDAEIKSEILKKRSLSMRTVVDSPTKAGELKIKDTRINRLQTQFDAARKSGNQTLERNLRSELNTAKKDRRKFVQETNQGALLESQSTIADLREEMKGADPSLAASYQADIDAEQAKIDGFIQQGVRTPAMETKAWKELEENVISKLQELTPEETDRLVDAGEISITPEQLSAVRKRFEEADIKTVEEIPRKLPPEEALLARTIISMEAQDQDTRAAARERMDNLWGTGNPGVSYAEQTQRMTAAASLDNARASLKNAETNLVKARETSRTAQNKNLNTAATRGIAHVTATEGFLAEFEDGEKDLKDADRFFSTRLNTTLANLRDEVDSLAQSRYQATANTLVQNWLNIYAVEGGSSFGDWWGSLWTDDPLSSNFASFELENIRLNDATNPEKLIIVGPDGKQLGTQFDIADLPKDKNFRNYILQTARRNMGE